MNLLSLVSGENSVRLFACPKKRDGAVFSRILASIYQTTRSHTTLHFKCYKGTLHADMPTWVTHLEIKPVHLYGVLDLRCNKLKAVPKTIMSCSNWYHSDFETGKEVTASVLKLRIFKECEKSELQHFNAVQLKAQIMNIAVHIHTLLGPRPTTDPWYS